MTIVEKYTGTASKEHLEFWFGKDPKWELPEPPEDHSYGKLKLVLQVKIVGELLNELSNFASVIGLNFDSRFIQAKITFLEELMQDANAIDSFDSFRDIEKKFSFYKEKIIDCKTKGELLANICHQALRKT